MTKYQDNPVFNQLRRDYTIATSASKTFSNNDLRGLLEILNTTTDINLQIRLFRALSAYLMIHKDTNLNVIIKCGAVYEKIHHVLTMGLPRKATDALNFLSALLYVDADEDATAHTRSLALYAKNMTRISGCLGVMTDLFTNSMMYHDTWKALCQCLAIACSDSEINQSYCTHLIPPCIQKCSQTNIDVFLVLQSLVLNHKQNIQLFLDSNGTSVFTRELLHYDKCVQLLTTVVQHSGALSMLRKTKVVDDLRDFLRLYGPDSQIGQKAMIILNHIEPRTTGLDSGTSRYINKEEKPLKIDCSNDMTIRKIEDLDDTKILMQNVMKEIYNYQQNEFGNLKKAAPNVEVTDLIRGASTMNLNSRYRKMHPKTTLSRAQTPREQQNSLDSHIATELSFNIYKNRNCTNNFDINDNSTIKSRRPYKIRTDKNTEKHKTQTLFNIERDLSYLCETTSEDLKDFNPIFSSTPKFKTDNSKQINYSKMLYSNRTTQSQMTQNRTNKVQKRGPEKVSRKNRSLSSRFFTVINESCTTLVKTVANIFKKKESPMFSIDDSCSQQSSPKLGNRSCSYSFLKYMQKRDALLNNKHLKNRRFKNSSESSLGIKSCETCNDTELLKHKLASDEHLKQTIKKLKLGINLYGCDFKKISRTMWPRESYMTPVVLYNLYRKLLLK